MKLRTMKACAVMAAALQISGNVCLAKALSPAGFGTGFGVAVQAPATLMNFVLASPLETQSRVFHARSFAAKSAAQFKALQLKAARLENLYAVSLMAAIPGTLLATVSEAKLVGEQGETFVENVWSLVGAPFLAGSNNAVEGNRLGKDLLLNASFATTVLPLVLYCIRLPAVLARRNMHRAFAAQAEKLFAYIQSPDFLKTHFLKWQGIASLSDFARKAERKEKISWYSGLAGFGAQALITLAALKYKDALGDYGASALTGLSWFLNPLFVKPLVQSVATRGLFLNRIERDMKALIGYKMGAR